MAPLLILVAVFVVAAAVLRLRGGASRLGLAGRIAAAAMFVFTGVSHFFFTSEMAEMVPPLLPRPILWVYLTGVLEILGGLGLLFERTRRASAWGLAVLLVALFPANVYAAMERVGMGRHTEGVGYLWLRAPLQAVFVAWVLWFGLRDDD